MYNLSEEFVEKFPYDKRDKYNIALLSFQYMLNNDFMDILTDISQEIGRGGEKIGFVFPNICEPDDEDYFENGVCFYFGDNEQIIEYDEFYNLLKITCDIYLESHQEDDKLVKKKLVIIKNRYKL